MMEQEYDEEDTIRKYINTYWIWYMTDLEKRCNRLGARQAKAKSGPDLGGAPRRPA